MIKEKTHDRYISFVQQHANGAPVKQIAAQNGMGVRGVEDGFKRLRTKYQAVSMAHLIGILYRKQLIH
jgi:hypothetical protein